MNLNVDWGTSFELKSQSQVKLAVSTGSECGLLRIAHYSLLEMGNGQKLLISCESVGL